MERTLENCDVIKHAIHIGVGNPEQYPDGTCLGYGTGFGAGDEPCYQCEKCRLYCGYEEEVN